MLLIIDNFLNLCNFEFLKIREKTVFVLAKDVNILEDMTRELILFLSKPRGMFILVSLVSPIFHTVVTLRIGHGNPIHYLNYI